MPPIRAIVFDFDGTLVDASDAIVASMKAVLSDHAVPVPEERAIRASIGRPLLEMFHAADPQADAERVQRYAREYRSFFFEHALHLTRPMPGVPEVIRTLAERCRLGIATTRKADGAIHILRSIGMLELFGIVIGLDEVSRPKPDPEPVLLALRHLQVSAAEALMVGDTPDDMMAGLLAGAVPVGVTTGAHDAERLDAAGARHVIASLHEIEALVVP